MNDDEIFKYIEYKSKLINPSPNKFKKEVKEFLINFSIKNNIKTDNLKELFYLYVNNLKEIPKCLYQNCNKTCRFLSYSQGFSIGCCHSHAKKISNLKKFGVETPFQSSKIQNKIKETIKEKYGVTAISQSKKYKETSLKKYGVEHPMKNLDVQQKVKNTFKDKYGVEHPMKNNQIKEKLFSTNYKKYGIKTSLDTINYKNLINCDKWNDKEFIKKNFINSDGFIKEIELKEFFNCSIENGNILKHIRKLNIPFKSKKTISQYEDLVIDFIKKINKKLKIIRNDREKLNGYEIDIYIPEVNLGIEINGIFWHSNKFKKDDYHYNKMRLSLNKNIKLIQIFDIEIKYNEAIIFKIIENEINKKNIKCDIENNWKIEKINKENLFLSSCQVNYFIKNDNNEINIIFGIDKEKLIIHYSFLAKDKTIEIIRKYYTNFDILWNRRFNIVENEKDEQINFNKISLARYLNNDLYITDSGYS